MIRVFDPYSGRCTGTFDGPLARTLNLRSSTFFIPSPPCWFKTLGVPTLWRVNRQLTTPHFRPPPGALRPLFSTPIHLILFRTTSTGVGGRGFMRMELSLSGPLPSCADTFIHICLHQKIQVRYQLEQKKRRPQNCQMAFAATLQLGCFFKVRLGHHQRSAIIRKPCGYSHRASTAGHPGRLWSLLQVKVRARAY